jgi:hypothetical protein
MLRLAFLKCSNTFKKDISTIKSTSADFDGGKITSDAGALLPFRID